MIHQGEKPARTAPAGGLRASPRPHDGTAPGRAVAWSFGLWIVLCMPAFLTQTTVGSRAATLAVCALFFPLALRGPWPVRLLLLAATWLVGAVQFTYFLAIGSPIDSYFWLTLSATNWHEVSGFLRQHAAALVVQAAAWGSLSGVVAAQLLMNPLPGRWIARWAMLSWSLFGIVGLAAALHDDPARFIAGNFGTTYHFRVWNAWHARSQFAQKFRSVVPDPPPPTSQPLADTVVLVIGESSSRSRWQSFGHAAPTNPFMSRRRDIVAFSDVVSNANMTAAAVPMLVAGKSLTSLAPGDPTLIDLAHRAGYGVTVASNQGRFSEAEDLFGVIFRRADHFVQAGQGDYDEVLTAPLQDALARGGRQFIVLHTYGSHHTASKRTPRRHKLLDDDYDNSIAYTDRLLDEWIGLLSRQPGPSVLLYISDHGVETERCEGRYMHGTSTSSYEVPMLLWASADSRDTALQRSMRIAAKNRGLPWQNTVAFATLADVLGYPALHYPSALQPSPALPARFAGDRPYEEVQPPQRCSAGSPP